MYSVLLYKKAKLGNPQKPSEEYLNFIVQGAVERGLPSAYVDQLRGVETKKAKFVVPRPRKSARQAVPGDECGSCGSAEEAGDLGNVIQINLGS